MPLAWWGQSGRPPPVRRLPPRRTRHRAYRERHPDTDKDTAHKPDQHLTGRQFQRRGGPVPRLRVTAGGAPAAGGEGCRSPADEAVEHGPARVQQARTGPARRPLLPYRPGTAPDRHAAGAGDQLPQHHLPEGLRRELLQGEGADEDVDDDASGESSAPCDGRRLFPLGLSRRAAPATGGTRAPEAPLVRRRRRQMPFLETPDGPMCGRTVRVPPYRAVRSGTSMPGGRHVPVVATGRGRRSWRWACGVRLIRVVGGTADEPGLGDRLGEEVARHQGQAACRARRPSSSTSVTSLRVTVRYTTSPRMTARKSTLVTTVPKPRPPSPVGWER